MATGRSDLAPATDGEVLLSGSSWRLGWEACEKREGGRTRAEPTSTQPWTTIAARVVGGGDGRLVAARVSPSQVAGALCTCHVHHYSIYRLTHDLAILNIHVFSKLQANLASIHVFIYEKIPYITLEKLLVPFLILKKFSFPI